MFNFHKETPIYLQLIDEIKLQIASGKLAPGTKLASIRELASVYSVNPNTVQRALLELERENLIVTQRASGKTVTEDVKIIEELRQGLAAERLENCLSALEALGYSREEIAALAAEAINKRKPHEGENIK